MFNIYDEPESPNEGAYLIYIYIYMYMCIYMFVYIYIYHEPEWPNDGAC